MYELFKDPAPYIKSSYTLLDIVLLEIEGSERLITHNLSTTAGLFSMTQNLTLCLVIKPLSYNILRP